MQHSFAAELSSVAAESSTLHERRQRIDPVIAAGDLWFRYDAGRDWVLPARRSAA